MSQLHHRHLIIFLAFHLLFLASPTLPDPDPDPATIQTQTLHPTPPATIPAFPEQSDVSACPLDLPDDLFRGIKSACASNPRHKPKPDYLSSDLRRTRCCPVLAAWLYSAYSKTGLRAAAAKPLTQTASYDMPVLPDDSEACVDTLEKALGSRGIQIPRPNETCDVVYCYCGIRLHPYTCPEAFWVNSGGELVGGDAVKKLERDCSSSSSSSNGGCSNCLNTLSLLNGDKAGRSGGNKTERVSKMHNQDCELMGLSWLLNKNRAGYIHTVSAVLRTLMMSTNNPAACSLNTDGMPLAVDSSEINSQSSSIILARSLHQYIVPLSLLCASALFLLTRY